MTPDEAQVGAISTVLRGPVAVTVTVQWVITAAFAIAAVGGGVAAARARRRREWAGETLLRLAAEQTALRRVATLVARESSPVEIFNVVTEEAREVLETDAVGLLRLEPDQSATLISQSRTPWDPPPLGTRFPLDGENVVTEVLRTGQATRVDDWSDATGSVASMAEVLGVRSAVATPVEVDGKMWGLMIAATSGSEPLPRETESRLEQFTGLVATAIANAQARADVSQLAEEQAALRRVAVLVAAQPSPDELFSAVTQAVARLLGADVSLMHAFRRDGATTVIAGWSGSSPDVSVGAEFPLDGDSLAARIFQTHAPARLDNYAEATGVTAAAARSVGLRSAVGAPIVVEGELWGALIAATRGDDPLPQNAERRIVAFTELVATAIANTESRSAFERLAGEQAALRRLATLVAKETQLAGVVAGVGEEIGKALGSVEWALMRDDGDGTATVLANSARTGISAGSRVPITTESAFGRAIIEGRPARIDNYPAVPGFFGNIARVGGVRASVSCPIVVRGRTWGAMSVGRLTTQAAFPPETEAAVERFVDLIATAIANAEARREVERLAEQQAALRRVATLVAVEAPQDEIFHAIAEGAAGVLGEDLRLVRYEGDVAVVVAASDEVPHEVLPLGMRIPIGGNNALSQVFLTGQPVRIDDYSKATGPAAEAVRAAGMRSIVGTPIVVEGRTWGAMLAAAFGDEPVPPGTEERLGQFVELMATAIANAEARAEIERLAEQEAALRRIATLIARGAEPEQVFAAVTDEAAAAFHAITAVTRFEHDPPTNIIVGVSKETHIPIGTRWPLGEGMASAEVYRTGRSARLGAVDWSSQPSPIAEAGLRFGVVSQVACPIIVEGGLWGVVTLNAAEELPADTEERLEKFTELVSTAIADAAAKSELAASRRRIVAAADEARRRIERDLHDGIQQRLIALTFRVRAMTRKPPDELPSLVAELAEGLKDTSDELREVSRGIYPTILAEGGLGPALRSLGRRSEVPIDVDVRLDERLPEALEAAAYYFASEALTNVAKHAGASVVQLTATCEKRVLSVEVRDDGIGGADAARGSGIVGLNDRVEALGGTMSLDSPAGGGTKLCARLPIAT